MNRLKLDFSLQTEEERTDFLNQYLIQKEFIQKPPTDDELETCANYVLWGKDKDGLSVVDKGEVQIETRYKTWARQDEESLEGLIEQPNFIEASIHPLTAQKQKKIKEVFSREEALLRAPSYLKDTFLELFHQIDVIDLIINFYELNHGKRKNPPRSELLDIFSQEEINNFQEKAAHLNQFQYLKLRHLLVELRRQQFTLRDSYTAPIQQRNFIFYNPPEEEEKLGDTIPIFPLGIDMGDYLSSLIFYDDNCFSPSSYKEKDLRLLKNFLDNLNIAGRPDTFFDFRELEHVYNLILNYEEIAAAAENDISFNGILKTLTFYENMAGLTPCQKRVIELKKKGLKNREIADIVNEEFGKAYTVNYISTIFRQKVIKKINESAKLHLEIIENLPFPENFKRCSCCGKSLLKDPRNFIRKTRTSDGYAARCKVCDKKVNKKNGK